MSGLSLFGSGLTITEAQGPTYYLGTWNASTNTPTLASSTAPAGPGGSYYIVSVAGTTNLNGITDWTVGDWVIWSGSVWQKLEGGMTSVTVGSTQIAGGTTGRVLYDNAGVLGEMTNTGTGTVNVLQTSPALITPALGIATGTSLALGGATIGSNALAVTGTTLFNGDVTLSAGVNISGSSTSTSSGFATYVTISTGAFYWNTRSVLRASANGTFKLTTNAENIGGVIDVATDSTFKFFGRDGTTRAIMEGGTLALGGATIGTNALAVTGTSQFTGLMSVTGSFSASDSIQAGNGDPLGWTSAAQMYSATDGVIRLSNNASTDFTRLQFGGTTSSFPAIKRNATALNFRLADDSADAPITAGAATFSTSVTWAYGSLDNTTGGQITMGGNTRIRAQSSGTLLISDVVSGAQATLNAATVNGSLGVNGAGNYFYSNNAAFVASSKTTLTNGAAAQVGTLTNAPAAGNPTKWIGIDDNGTTRYIPAW